MDDTGDRRPRARAAVWLAAGALGAAAGLGGFTLSYGEALSYFSTDPAACANCHIMQSQYDSWQKASHHTVATCVDCHLPHTMVAKYLAKAENGYFHSKGFTFGGFAEPIVIKASNSRILQDNCVACHGSMTADLAAAEPDAAQAAQVPCVHCHSGVGHGERAGLGGPEEDDG